MENPTIPFVYFGGEPIGVPVLEELAAVGLTPLTVIINPDKPVGRQQILTPPPVKKWTKARNIPVWQPDGWRGEAGPKK